MSSTVRVYVNDKRIATGKPWKNEFLQVYPEKKTFASEAEWRTSIYQSLMPTIKFVATEAAVKVKPLVKEEVKPIVKPEPLKVPTLSTNKNDWMYQKTSKMTLPPGTYYIGDLCYALNDTLYDTVFGPQYRDGYYCSQTNPSDVFMMGRTDDGLYYGTDGKDYAVDAGIIGIASESTLGPEKKPYNGGSLYTFKNEVTVKLRRDKFLFDGNGYGDPHLTIYINEEEYDDSE